MMMKVRFSRLSWRRDQTMMMLVRYLLCRGSGGRAEKYRGGRCRAGACGGVGREEGVR